MSPLKQQQIVISGASADELMRVKGFIQFEIIRFGEQPAEFKLQEAPPRLIWAGSSGIYLKDGQPWAYPFTRVLQKFPGVHFSVEYHDGEIMKEASFPLDDARSRGAKLETDREPNTHEKAYYEGITKKFSETTDSNSAPVQDAPRNAFPSISEQDESANQETSRQFSKQAPTVAQQPGIQTDLSEQRIAIVQQQLDAAEGQALSAENRIAEAEKRAANAEALLEEEKQNRFKAELEIKKFEQSKRETEAQNSLVENRTIVAEIDAVTAEENAAKDRFMSSMLAIKSQLAEPELDDPMSTGELEDNQGLASLSRIAHLLRQDKNADGMNAFHKAAKAGSFSKFTPDELNLHNLLSRDDEGNTALHWAAAKGILSQLPGHILTPHNLLLKNNHRATCLHLAALGGCMRDLPADILTMQHVLDETNTGCTCLHLAAINGLLLEMPEQFFTHEALNTRNQNGQTPIEVTDAGGHADNVPSEIRAVAADPNATATGKLLKFKESLRKMRWQI